MLKMKYDCEMEKKAAEKDPCKKIPPRERFMYRGRNYDYIETPIVNFRAILSPADALLAAMRRWWNTHLYHHGLRDLIPRRKDYTVLPFLAVR
ncbi:hypothetical protein TELCIR_19481 [Teladorsagia circumcincta]|uniref:Uncharacterized protein n=1 Tax=Teladorsagia circumcincta TaxID=45464 RepID=A0A2G9TMD9_TELCI|nr:hypothetical protein TELCIR_19481 [Teladorsagia circumcincta]